MSFEANSGDMGEFKKAENTKCRKCGEDNVVYAVWESSCGGYEDYHYKCQSCNHSWWVDGIDS